MNCEQPTEFRTDELHLTITDAPLEFESLNPTEPLRMVPSENKQTTDLPTRSESKASERGSWAHHTEYLLSAMGYSISISNVWRFPFFVMRNGGGKYLSPSCRHEYSSRLLTRESYRLSARCMQARS